MGTLFIPKEVTPGETRVAANPESVKKYVSLGFDVKVETGAGSGASISDADFTKAGASIVPDASAGFGSADVVVKLNPPTKDEVGKMKAGALLVSFLWPLTDHDLVKTLAGAKVDGFAMDMVPRITRAQKMDALSSQSNIAGYKAVLLGAVHAPKLFPMLMTAAGTIRPSRVVIMGAGVAGLQAIATAKRLGAIVEVSDIRPAVKEQVESLGGTFIEVETDENMEDAGGYAKEASKEFLAKQQAVVREHITKADVVITTALVPGKKAPVLIPEDMVKDMKSGSVIVDLAVEQGGNCALSEVGKVVTVHNVTIVGQTNIPGTVPVHSTDMYAKNVLNVLMDMVKDGAVQVDFEDEVVAGALITHQGEIKNQRVVETMQGGGN